VGGVLPNTLGVKQSHREEVRRMVQVRPSVMLSM
jgi:hypothetical protein